MSEEKITRDELLILLRDTYLSMNDLTNRLRDIFLENMDDIVTALVRQNKNNKPNSDHH